MSIRRAIQTIVYRPGTDAAGTCQFLSTAVLAHRYATPVTVGEKIVGIAQLTFLHDLYEYSFPSLFINVAGRAREKVACPLFL